VPLALQQQICARNNWTRRHQWGMQNRKERIWKTYVGLVQSTHYNAPWNLFYRKTRCGTVNCLIRTLIVKELRHLLSQHLPGTEQKYDRPQTVSSRSSEPPVTNLPNTSGNQYTVTFGGLWGPPRLLSNGYRGSLGVKRPESEGSHWPPPSAKVKNACSYTSIPSHVRMGQCLFKHRGQLYFVTFT
jgi:hypothetical protein